MQVYPAITEWKKMNQELEIEDPKWHKGHTCLKKAVFNIFVQLFKMKYAYTVMEVFLDSLACHTGLFRAGCMVGCQTFSWAHKVKPQDFVAHLEHQWYELNTQLFKSCISILFLCIRAVCCTSSCVCLLLAHSPQIQRGKSGLLAAQLQHIMEHFTRDMQGQNKL